MEDQDDQVEENSAYLDYLDSREQQDHDDDSDDGSDWSLDLMMEEDIYFVTPLDKLDAYTVFGGVISQLMVSPLTSQPLQTHLTPEKKNFIESLIQKAGKS